MKKIFFAALLFTIHYSPFTSLAQQTFPINGTHDEREGNYAFTHATIAVDYKTFLNDATLLIHDGKIVAVGNAVTVPAGVTVIDCKGKFIYPSFIDLFSNYGITKTETPNNNQQGPQFISNKSGAYSWNQAIMPEVNGADFFHGDDKQAENLRSLGFGAVLTHRMDGILRGTGAVVLVGNENDNEMIVRGNVASFYSFNKGTSTQDYPSSLMGSIALLRQTFYDSQWYKSGGSNEEKNISLEALNSQFSLPQIFQVDNDLSVLRADKIGDEFGLKFIIKGGGDEYKGLDEIKATGDALIVPINFPKPYNVNDPNDADLISLSDLMNWEQAPANLFRIDKAGINFCITKQGCNDDAFWKNLRKAIAYGLNQSDALKALTYTPAQLSGELNNLGSLEKGKLANFIICSDSIFNDKNIIYQNWVKGKMYRVNDEQLSGLKGIYDFTLNRMGAIKLTIENPSSNSAQLQFHDSTKSDVKFSLNDNLISLSFSMPKDSTKQLYRLNGFIEGENFLGKGLDPNGKEVVWTATRTGDVQAKKDSSKKENIKPEFGNVIYPFCAYGWDSIPKQETVLFKNATVWTNEAEGNLENTDLLISNGKIQQVGKNISVPANARVIDATGKFLTAGIIDEHSHIAISQGVNEGTQSVTSEVRIGDVVNSEDINIYRNLAGGVTCSHLLHGSANTIGGQTQLIKLRWGYAPEQMKFVGWNGFIKFALGENVKQSNWGDRNTVRFPQTRMGVEQTLFDGFIRARQYQSDWDKWNSTAAKNKTTLTGPRRDLELDALVEILISKRYITCHSYVQSEINMLIHVADSMHFHMNTFTHILEGYKVADKMRAHGVYASTFSDWWAYKYEVYDAIPYNAAILTKVGVVTAVNSDDAEMARRLNQEAAKSIKYGRLSEIEAWKLCTLNPAMMLHIDAQVGSIKVGKDADLVLWNNNPLSIYAKPEYTFVDGICFFSLQLDQQKRNFIHTERTRIINEMLTAIKNGEQPQDFNLNFNLLYNCDSVCDGSQIGGK
ncbi:periplasmic amidohydrolase [Bacteroidota bacterium]|nr:periplasmic amidohydrolase [Bacteroidota bacterium]